MRAAYKWFILKLKNIKINGQLFFFDKFGWNQIFKSWITTGREFKHKRTYCYILYTKYSNKIIKIFRLKLMIFLIYLYY